MKNFILLLVLCFASLSTQAQKFDYSDSQIKNTFGELLREAGKYALMEMRPTATINRARIIKVKNDNRENGGDIKARVEISWTTAWTGKSRTHQNDVWLQIEGDNVYFTRYYHGPKHIEDHNIPIANNTNVKMKELVGTFSSSDSNDDF